MDNMKMGAFIAQLRKERGMTQREQSERSAARKYLRLEKKLR